ncbi:hypothetical protein FA13DRAFT_1724210 [Coprinellus micaceus]|uniref:Uncharacterized protein n=1 Tax=Coprinellus micaceus TaxID=71717 RepID=A0A4Y7U0N9_COPMI|nr:hypothetical protein FA13DRAFT_1732267 [Coprinellus micaceus]TEB39990.1 hypothetical protein FA13DRAFT_1724210 [Coprinellus micaceus]
MLCVAECETILRNGLSLDRTWTHGASVTRSQPYPRFKGDLEQDKIKNATRVLERAI